jgi:hypothetical protein
MQPRGLASATLSGSLIRCRFVRFRYRWPARWPRPRRATKLRIEGKAAYVIAYGDVVELRFNVSMAQERLALLRPTAFRVGSEMLGHAVHDLKVG